MVQLSPDTEDRAAQGAYGWAAGYRYDDRTIIGFSHTISPAPATPTSATS